MGSAPGDSLHLDVDVGHPMVASLVDDRLLLGLWGFIRLAPRPMTLTEIARATHVDAAIVQRKLDILSTYQLVESLAAAARRPGISYRARYLALRIVFRPDGDEATVQRIAEALQRHARDLLAAMRPESASADPGGLSSAFSGIFNLTPHEVEELQRRMNGVREYAEVRGHKFAKRGTAPELCNYAFHFRMEPLPAPALPLVPIRFVKEGADPSPGPESNGHPSGNGHLSPRERETALALARGLTIAEVAKELRLAHSTVATLAKRVYRKLGAHRRAEMMTRLSELGLTP